MDILNWLYLVKNKFTRTTIENPATDLIVLGADVGFQKRGDKYQNYVMTAQDFIGSGLIAATAHYELDITATSTVTVNTTRGIIDILGMGTSAPLTPGAAYATSVSFTIDNLDLDLSVLNRDNVYVQYSVYYKNTITDNAIPHLIAVGAATGLEFNLYNANPAVAGANNWDGDLYVYFELYTINN
jgi:hypothetical protein